MPAFILHSLQKIVRSVKTVPKINKKMSPIVFKTVESVLEALEEYQEDKEHVKELIQIYNHTYKKNKKFLKEKKHPLIVLEGLDGCGKSTGMKILSENIHAWKWNTPPRSIGHLRPLFDEDWVIRTAYYALGNYIAALEISSILRQKTIVMDRFWHSTAAYALAQSVYDNPKLKMPEEDDPIYEWPKDLLKPDIVFFLFTDEDIRLSRLRRRKSFTLQENLLSDSDDFRNNVLFAYKNIRNPSITMIDSNHTKDNTQNQMQKKVDELMAAPV